MKQQIICEDCEKDLKELYELKPPPRGEHIKFVKGKAKREFLCDFCGIPIEKNQSCHAFSIWADHGAQPYYEWEPDYIVVDKT